MLKSLKILLSLALCVPLFACAEKEESSNSFDATTYSLGKEYEAVLEPLRTQNSDKIEVIEFFWYGCRHCYSLETHVEPWKKTLKEDVDFYVVPVTFQRTHKLHARIYYLAKTLGIEEKIHSAVFHEMHENKNPLPDEESVKAFLLKNGVTEEQFTKHFKSFGVESSLKKADSKSLSAGILGTPTFVINGKYVTGAAKAGGEKELFDVINFLIEKERRGSSTSNNN